MYVCMYVCMYMPLIKPITNYRTVHRVLGIYNYILFICVMEEKGFDTGSNQA